MIRDHRSHLELRVLDEAFTDGRPIAPKLTFSIKSGRRKAVLARAGAGKLDRSGPLGRADDPGLVLKLTAVAVGVFVTATASLIFTRFEGHVAGLWLTNAIAVAVMLRSPRGSWSLILTVATLANIAAKLAFGIPPLTGIGTALSSALESLVCAALTLRLTGAALDISRPGHLARFSAAVALVATPLAAIPGGLTLWLGGGIGLVNAIILWWRVDTLGLLVGGPVLLALTRQSTLDLWRALRRGRGLVSVGVFALSLFLALGQHGAPLLFLPPSALMLIAFELNVAGTAVALLINAVAMITMLLTRTPASIYEHRPFTEQLLMMQVFLAVTSATVLPVAAALASRQRLEGELREALAQAQAASEAKADFLANMSHEIRTPLTAIIGFSGLLDSAAGLPSQARLYVERIGRSGRALLSIVNDILDFSRIEAGHVTLSLAPVDPLALARGTLDLVEDQAAAKGLALTLDGPPDLGLVMADAERVRQVLLNLVSNAIKFTARGGVSVRVAREGARLTFSVTDTGVGVPEALVPRLFDRFWQVDNSSTRQFGGSGLGLAICKSLVDLMGGDIGVESREGQGSTFWFGLPAPSAQAAEPDKVGVEGPAVVSAAHILVVDDVPANRELVRAMLTAMGHSLVEAEGGAEAVAAAEQETFDLILMDMQMPGMDGLEATRAIRAGSAPNVATPIVALTANVLPAQVAQCLEAGMNDHLAKPIAPMELLSKIARWSRSAQTHSSQAA